MSPALQLCLYVLAVTCFVLAALGLPRTARRPVALGWLGAALLSTIGLVAAYQAAF
jgi:NAD/NADP transhydrogenase beta subunit